MARLGIDKLPPARRAAKRLLNAIGFESKKEAGAEDGRRARALRRHARNSAAAQSRPCLAERLARKLKHNIRPKPLNETLASSGYCRKIRRRLTSALLRLAAQFDAAQVTTFTLISRKWTLRPSQLNSFNPREMLKAVRADLYRLDVARLDGALFLVVHGEWEPTRGFYQLHVHGVGFGEIIQAVHALRKVPKYRRVTGDDVATLPIRRPVWINTPPLTEPAKPLSYVFKAYWPERPLYRTEKGKLRRGKGRRIHSPYHTHYLLWLDRWSLADITMMIGMRVGKYGFQLSQGGR